MDIHNEQWHEARRKAIGASEVAAILGVSPFKSALELWGEKTGLLDSEPDEAALERMGWGTRLEPVILAAYAEQSGLVVTRHPQSEVLYHPRHPEVPLSATPDAFDGEGLVEAKNVSAWLKNDWLDQPPLHYQIQCQAQMAVTGRPYATLVGLVGGHELIAHRIDRNDEFIRQLELTAADWWTTYVVAGVEPPAEPSESSVRALARLHPDDSGEEVQLSAEFDEVDARLLELKETIKQLEGERSDLENKLKSAIGSATFGRLGCGARYAWKSQTSKHAAKDAFVSTYRVLRRCK